MGSKRRLSEGNADESASLATLGSFGSASWVAEQFGNSRNQQQVQQQPQQSQNQNHIPDPIHIQGQISNSNIDEVEHQGAQPSHSNFNKNVDVNILSRSRSISPFIQMDESVEYNFECTNCSRSFSSLEQLQIHLEHDHPSSSSPQPRLQTPQQLQPQQQSRHQSSRQQHLRAFKCPHCKKAFTRRSEMGRHVGTQHDNRTSFLHCERCAFKHEDPQMFHKHVADKHKRCKYCRNQFKQLKKHENSCHLKPD